MPNEIYVDEAVDEKDAKRIDELCDAFKAIIKEKVTGWAQEDGSEKWTPAHCDMSLSAILNAAVECAKAARVPREVLLDFIGRAFDVK